MTLSLFVIALISCAPAIAASAAQLDKGGTTGSAIVVFAAYFAVTFFILFVIWSVVVFIDAITLGVFRR